MQPPATGTRCEGWGWPARGASTRGEAWSTGAPNLVWKDTPVVSVLEQRLQLPAVLLQDARAAALGEALLGAGRGHQDFLYTVLGEGVGSAVILGGQPLVGKQGAAG